MIALTALITIALILAVGACAGGFYIWWKLRLHMDLTDYAMSRLKGYQEQTEQSKKTIESLKELEQSYKEITARYDALNLKWQEYLRDAANYAAFQASRRNIERDNTRHTPKAKRGRPRKQVA